MEVTTSRDGLNFTRQPDVKLAGAPNWLGHAQSDGEVLRFFGTGGPNGLWVATSTNGQSWTIDRDFPAVRGADPGAVKLNDESWLLLVTGPPRENRRSAGPAAQAATSSLLVTFDTNHDGEISAQEIESAPAALRRLDRNADGKLSAEETRPSIR